MTSQTFTTGATEEHQAEQANRKNPLLPWIIVAVILLAANLVVTGYTQYENARLQAMRIENLVDAQINLDTQLATLFDNYEAVAYDNPDVDRIVVQQLLAQEFTLRALTLIGEQNSLIIEQLTYLH